MEKCICIHGHFYQPPRENPWLEDVELQDSAYPFHDWNARIAEECYRQNAASRILTEDKKVIDIGSFYADSSAFTSCVGWTPRVPLEEGLRRTIAFYRAHFHRYVDVSDPRPLETV